MEEEKSKLWIDITMSVVVGSVAFLLTFAIIPIVAEFISGENFSPDNKVELFETGMFIGTFFMLIHFIRTRVR